VVTSRTQADIEQMRDQVFFEGTERNRRLTRCWLLLLLSAVIATMRLGTRSAGLARGSPAQLGFWWWKRLLPLQDSF
jgi:hypothetical protein